LSSMYDSFRTSLKVAGNEKERGLE
jgi:hypothetical protein